MTAVPPRVGWTAALLAAGGAAYLSWVLAPWVAPGGLDPVTTYASELAATDQPRSWFFRASDAMAGILVALAALNVLRAAQRSALVERSVATRRERLGWWALLVFGVATVADALAPLSCAPSVDQLCAARERTFEVPLTHTVHVATSTTASAAMLVTVLALTWWARGRPGVEALGVGAALRAAAAGFVVGTAWTLLEIGRAAVAWPWPALLGVAQRVQVGSAAVWLLALAVACWRGRRG